MSQLLLIRHGQATPFDTDTDQLSALGEAQARLIGGALRAEGLKVTHLLHGPLVRQRRTALIAAGGADWPAPQQDARLAEYDGDGLLRHLAPLLSERDAAFAQLVEGFERQKSGPERNKHLQAMLEPLTASLPARRTAAPRTGELGRLSGAGPGLAA